MLKHHTAFATLVTALLLVACETNAFRSGTEAPKTAEQETSTVSPEEQDEPRIAPSPVPSRIPHTEVIVVATPAPTPEPTVAPTPTPPPPPPPDICTKTFKILIIDLKSGWFAGDGGDFFKGFTANKCEDQVQLSYIHITRDFAEGNFSQFKDYTDVLPCLKGLTPNEKGRLLFTGGDSNTLCEFGSLSAYNQLWILSGNESDPFDLRIAKPLFASLKKRALEFKAERADAGFFFGAGLGNAQHANSLAVTLFPSLFESTDAGRAKPFSESMSTASADIGVFPNPKQLVNEFTKAPLVAGNGQSAGTFDQTSSVFSGLTSLYDYSKTAARIMKPSSDEYSKEFVLGECFTNPIIATKVKVIATDHCQNPAVATATQGKQKIYLEGNLSRFYGMTPTEYFHRIIIDLLPTN